MIVHPMAPDLRLLELKDLCPQTPDTDLTELEKNVLDTLLPWAQSFLCDRDHPDLGRKGAVCPYVPGSLHKELFWLATCAHTSPPMDVEAAASEILRYRDWFLQLSPTEGAEADFKTIVVAFSGLTHNQGSFIEAVHQTCKPLLLPHRMMIGQFYPRCDHTGTYSKTFQAYRSPMALLALRHMTPTDINFLADRPEFMNDYARFYGEKVDIGSHSGVTTSKLEKPH